MKNVFLTFQSVKDGNIILWMQSSFYFTLEVDTLLLFCKLPFLLHITRTNETLLSLPCLLGCNRSKKNMKSKMTFFFRIYIVCKQHFCKHFHCLLQNTLSQKCICAYSLRLSSIKSCLLCWHYVIIHFESCFLMLKKRKKKDSFFLGGGAKNNRWPWKINVLFQQFLKAFFFHLLLFLFCISVKV